MNNNDLNLNVKCYQNYSYSDIIFWSFFSNPEKCRGHIKGIDYLLTVTVPATATPLVHTLFLCALICFCRRASVGVSWPGFLI